MSGPAARFALGPRLGQGASGAVFEALDARSGERVALKSLPRLTGAPLSRLRDRIEPLVRLRHPNVVRVRELVEGETHELHLLMDLAAGRDVLTYVAGHEPIAPITHLARPNLPMVFGQRLPEGYVSEFTACSAPQIARLRAAFGQLARALVALHAIGIVHGDIRPSNILVTDDGHLTLVDLDGSGDAEEPDALFAGTAAYMAPEQGERDSTAAVDWYAAGVILFEAVTRALPFSGSAQEMLVRKQTLPAPRASSLVRGVPHDLDELCAQLLARQPGLRPADDELQRSFEAP